MVLINECYFRKMEAKHLKIMLIVHQLIFLIISIFKNKIQNNNDCLYNIKPLHLLL